MRDWARRVAKAAAMRVGLDIRRAIPVHLGVDPYRDAKLRADPKPVLFDVGANVGQTVARLRKEFPAGEIHSFEPNPLAFDELRAATAGMARVQAWNVALGDAEGTLPFIVRQPSDLSSFLEAGAGCGKEERRIPVPVRTLDSYCEERGVRSIDLLKLDTQGYDLAVLAGSRRLLAERRVRQVLIEVTYCELYRGMPAPDAVHATLRGHGLRLVSFYTMQYRDGFAGWNDALYALQE